MATMPSTSLIFKILQPNGAGSPVIPIYYLSFCVYLQT